MNKDDVTFRLATHSDDEALIDLKLAINLAEHGAYPQDGNIPDLLDLSRSAAALGIADYWLRIHTHGGAFLVGEMKGDIVCCGCWCGETAAVSTRPQFRNQATIGAIVVLPIVRGYGLGRRIMSELEALIRAAGISTARLTVVPGNTPAEDLYRGLGFEDFDTVMIKKLD